MRILVPLAFLPVGLPENPSDKQKVSFIAASATTTFEYDAVLRRWFKLVGET